tara:strand:- start:697 stop:867 length:171 start_codon:yes stop_codon:yes gene_type:complete
VFAESVAVPPEFVLRGNLKFARKVKPHSFFPDAWPRGGAKRELETGCSKWSEAKAS